MVLSSAVKSAFSVLLKLSGAGLAFFFYAMVSRSMAIESAGVFFFMMAFCLVVSGLARFGLDHAIVRYVSQRGVGDCQSVVVPVYQALIISVLISILVSVLVYVFIPQFLSFSNLPARAEEIVFLLLFSIAPTTLYTAVVAILNGIERNVLASFVQTGAFQIIVVVATVGAQWFLPDISADLVFAVAYAASAFVVAVFSFVMCLIFFGRAPVLGVLLNRDFELLRNGVALFPGAIADLVINGLPSVLIGLVATPVEVAKFSVPQRIANVVYFVFASVNTVFAPKIGRAARDCEGVRALYFQAVRLMLFAIVPVVIILGGGGREVLSLFGRDYVDGYSSLLCLLLNQVVHALFGPVLTILVMHGYRKKYSAAMFLGAAATSGGVLVLGGEYGAVGASVGVFAGVLIQKSCGFAFARSLLR